MTPILFFLLCVAVVAMWWLVYGSRPFNPGQNYRKCPDCLRWHQKGKITYLHAFISNPVWEHCPDCAKRKTEN